MAQRARFQYDGGAMARNVPVIALLGFLACGGGATRPREPSDPGTAIGASGATSNAGAAGNASPPLLLACRNSAAAGTPTSFVWTGGGFVTAHPGDGPLYVSAVDAQGRLQSRRKVDLRPDIQFSHDVAQAVQSVFVNGRAVLMPLDRNGNVVEITVKPDGWVDRVRKVLHPDRSVRSSVGARGHQFLALAASIRAPTRNRFEDRSVIELYSLDDLHRAAIIDASCHLIDDVVATSWGFAAVCTTFTPFEAEGATEAHDRIRTVLGIVDGRLAWRFEGLARNLWWAAMGTDGENLLVVQDGQGIVEKGTPYPLRSVRIDRHGRQVGSPVAGLGRVPGWPEALRVVYAKDEWATVHGATITRFDAHGDPLGSWFIEPDCLREVGSAAAVWTGDAYALCAAPGGLIYEKDDPMYESACDEERRAYAVYPNLKFDPAEVDRDVNLNE